MEIDFIAEKSMEINFHPMTFNQSEIEQRCMTCSRTTDDDTFSSYFEAGHEYKKLKMSFSWPFFPRDGNFRKIGSKNFKVFEQFSRMHLSKQFIEPTARDSLNL